MIAPAGFRPDYGRATILRDVAEPTSGAHNETPPDSDPGASVADGIRSIVRD
jgi:hypothetical protein